MCFTIRVSSQQPWRNRTVYRLVRRDYKGPHYPVAGQTFRPGNTVEATNVQERDPSLTTPSYFAVGPHPFGVGVIYSRHSWFNERKAVAGIYVYRTLKIARAFASQNPGRILVRCAVSPQDFLFHNVSDGIATYRKVRVMEVVS